MSETVTLLSDVQAHVDSMGYVWIGPFYGEGFSYLRFHGVYDVRDPKTFEYLGKSGDACWVWELSEPELDWEPMHAGRLERFLLLHGATNANVGHLVPRRST